MLTPIAAISIFFFGLLSLALPILGLWLLTRAARRLTQTRPVVHESSIGGSLGASPLAVSAPVVTQHRLSLRDRVVQLPFIAGCALLLVALGGRPLLLLTYPAGSDEPLEDRGGVARSIPGTGGSTIHTETYGNANAPTLVLTHGWGTNSTEWHYAKKHLADRFRLIVWDSPGLGESTPPETRDYSLERQASDLRAVLLLAGGRPVVLVGHSIGGMVNLTFCRMFPDLIGKQVAGIVQLDTSYTNPVKTTKNAELNLALQKPVGEPVLHLMIALSPLVRMMKLDELPERHGATDERSERLRRVRDPRAT